MRALVLGAGKSGNAAAELARRRGVEVVVLDGDAAMPDESFDFCIASPGIAPSHPWRKACEERGIKVISELQFGAGYWKGRMFAVTGSKGKSSVVKLVANALGGIPCGNYGKPLCEVVLENDGREEGLPDAVVEVSSFQMETTDDFHPEAALLLNLQEDHLDRHGSVQVYHALKLRLLAGAKKALDFSKVALADVSERDRSLFAGSYFDNPVLAVNAAGAIALMRAAGLGDAAIAAAFARFEPLPHRFQTVLEKDGVRWVDDSKSTSLASLVAGVMMADCRVNLIAGGLGKGDEPDACIPYLQSGAEKVYLIGSCAERLYAAWKDSVPCEMCGSLDNAVAAARHDVHAGGMVLLSPGAASFDQFNSYSERGEIFANLAKEGKRK